MKKTIFSKQIKKLYIIGAFFLLMCGIAVFATKSGNITAGISAMSIALLIGIYLTFASLKIRCPACNKLIDIRIRPKYCPYCAKSFLIEDGEETKNAKNSDNQ